MEPHTSENSGHDSSPPDPFPSRRHSHSSSPRRNETPSQRDSSPLQSNSKHNESDDIIHNLMRNPALRDPIRTPRFPIVLCHGACTLNISFCVYVATHQWIGLYGFDVRGFSSIPALRMHYWADVRTILRKTVGADVIIGSVPGYDSAFVTIP
jgi:triacylglycerol lipase